MVDIRLVVLEDVDRLLECEIAIWESLREMLPDSFVDPNINGLRRPDVIERRKSQLQSLESVFLVVEENEEFIGVAIGRVWEDGVAVLGFFGVKPLHRRKGVGFSLLSRFVDEAKKRKAHKVWLLTAPSLQSAIRLYVKAGFVPEGYLRKHSYGQDLILYSKFLT
jgi:ribosomal protein S18 acetylase RimI-like enzyme